MSNSKRNDPMTVNLNSTFSVHKDKLIGQGSFSKVYSGTNIKTKQKVAVKVIKVPDKEDKHYKVVEDEINIMLLIKEDPYPNIVECYDVIRHPNKSYIFIVMEYCDSGDLREILKKPIQEKYAQFYFSQLANGLKYLDTKGIIHRDIKPRNILLTNQRKILKIADFGFAKQVVQNQNKPVNLYDTMCGSPLYMAPEIMNSGGYNKQIDLWSIGMILYEMLYSVHPFGECKNITDLMSCIADKPIIIPALDIKGDMINSSVSDECISLLKNLLQKDVINRITWEQFFKHPWVEYKFTDTVAVSNPTPTPITKNKAKLGLYKNSEPININTNNKINKQINNRRKESYNENICATSIGSVSQRDSELLDKSVNIIDNYYESMYFSTRGFSDKCLNKDLDVQVTENSTFLNETDCNYNKYEMIDF